MEGAVSMLIKVAKSLTEALRRVRALLPRGAPWDSATWQDKSTQLRERSFFSATVESRRFLSVAQNFVADYLERTVEVLPTGKRVLRGGRARFVQELRTLLEEYPGLLPVGHKHGLSEKDLRNLKGESRLELIFDTNVRQAFGFGEATQAHNPVVLQAFPGWRFRRVGTRDEPRERHEAAEGQVRLKTDKTFWLYQNARDIGGFGVPYGPWGFQSGMGVEDVPRDVVENLGLLKTNRVVEPNPPGFNDGLRASLKKVNPDQIKRLREELGKKYKFTREGNVVRK